MESLIPYARNARTHSEAQVALIAGSIREFGFANPVLVDGENGIIAGHGRVLAARKLGLDRGAGDRARRISAEAQKRALHPRRQQARRAGWLGPRDAGAGSRRACRARRRPRRPRLRGGRDRRSPPWRRADPREEETPEPPAVPVSQPRRSLAARPAPAALRQRHRSRRRGAAAGRRRAAPDGHAIRRMA